MTILGLLVWCKLYYMSAERGTLCALGQRMNKKLALKTFRFCTAFMLGGLSATSLIAYGFTKTTVSYRSTLFPGHNIVIRDGKLTKLVRFQ